MKPRLSRVNRLDDLRAVAASLVFACHASLFWLAWHDGRVDSGVFYLGRFGVAIFFVVSGLVIYRPFVQARWSETKPDLWAYAVRRVLRIVPAYWIALAFFIVVFPREVPPLGTGNPGLFAGFAQIYSPANYYSGLPVAWTLDVEVCFYAAAPLIALGVRRLIVRGCSRNVEGLVLLGLGVVSIAVRRFSPDGVIGGTILGYGGWFAIGMALAVLAAQPTQLLRRIKLPPTSLWALAGLGYLLLSDHLARPIPYPNRATADAARCLVRAATLSRRCCPTSRPKPGATHHGHADGRDDHLMSADQSRASVNATRTRGCGSADGRGASLPVTPSPPPARLRPARRPRRRQQGGGLSRLGSAAAITPPERSDGDIRFRRDGTQHATVIESLTPRQAQT